MFVIVFCLIGWSNKKANDDGWDDEPAPKSNGKRVSDWDDDDDWGSSKKPRNNGNQCSGCWVVFFFHCLSVYFRE